MLGSSCSIPRPGRACSSYLIEHAGTAVIADLGSGAFARLVAHCSLEEIGAVVISHMHADHFLDLIPLRYALKYGDRSDARRVPLYLPPGGAPMLRALAATFHPETGDDFLGSVFDVRTFSPDATMRIGGIDVRFTPTTHYIDCYAMRFEAAGRSITYSADTAPDDRVVALARDTDLFVCEASLSRAEEGDVPHGHSSAFEAGRMAEAASVRRLILSHYPAQSDALAMERDARHNFRGDVTVADDGATFEA